MHPQLNLGHARLRRMAYEAGDLDAHEWLDECARNCRQVAP